jgi:hypothetical protein
LMFVCLQSFTIHTQCSALYITCCTYECIDVAVSQPPSPPLTAACHGHGHSWPNAACCWPRSATACQDFLLLAKAQRSSQYDVGHMEVVHALHKHSTLHSTFVALLVVSNRSNADSVEHHSLDGQREGKSGDSLTRALVHTI